MHFRHFNNLNQKLLTDSPVLFHTYIPLESHTVKKNSRPILRNRRTGARFIGKSSTLLLAENELVAEFRSAARHMKEFKTIDQPCWAMMLFYFDHDEFFTKKGTVSRNIGDLSNLYELPQDCLKTAGIITDDSIIFSHDLSRRIPWHETALELLLFEYNSEQDFNLRKTAAKGDGSVSGRS